MKRTNRLGRIQVPIKVIEISDIRQIPEREKICVLVSVWRLCG